MEKSKTYPLAKFTADKIRNAIDNHIVRREGQKIDCYYYLNTGNESWIFDDEYEYFAAYRVDHVDSWIKKTDAQYSIKIRYCKNQHTIISVKASSRGEIESVFAIFEDSYHDSKIMNISAKTPPSIFIGHGRSQQWRDLKDHLYDKHGYKIEAYESGPRAGYTITQVLDSMAAESSFAVLVMTGEDRDQDGVARARQNVIHEIGLFQGKLGFSKTIVLLEDGTDEFTNLSGIQQIRYSKGNIRETFGEVLATLRREFE